MKENGSNFWDKNEHFNQESAQQSRTIQNSSLLVMNDFSSFSMKKLTSHYWIG